MGSRDPDTSEQDALNESNEIEEMAQATAIDPYRVRGFNGADASGGDNPTGVLGRTNGSGQTYGVQGVSASDGDSIDDVFPAGVYGEATGGQATFGVHGVTQGSGAYAAGVKAEASDSDASALNAVNLLGSAIRARSNSSNSAVVDVTRGLGDAPVVLALNRATPSSGSTTGIEAEVEAGTDGSKGVVGQATAGSGRTSGVFGFSNSTDTNASGVRGKAYGGSGAVYGVHGVTDSADGTAEPAGVYGEASSLTGWTYGLHGVTNSDNNNAAGVRAEADGSALGLFAESTGHHGVSGVTKDGAKSGVFGINNADSNASSTGHGVRATTDSTGTASAGAYGTATQGSGQTYGVRGETASTDAAAAGVYGEATNSSGNAAAIKAEGHVDVSSVGLTAYRSGAAGAQSIGTGGSNTTVKFDAVWNARDDFDGLDTSSGIYTVGAAGDYHVSTSVEWVHKFSGGDIHKIFITVNGSAVASRYHEVPGASGESSYVHDHVCKTLYGLGEGDTIAIEVYQETGASKDLSYDRDSTYVTIDKVG